MGTSKRIDISLFDESLISLINASAKIMPVEYTYVEAGTNPSNYEFVRILSGDHKNEFYVWQDNAWSLFGADDNSVPWADVTGKPTTFPPSTHSHSIATVQGLQAALDGKSATTHNHDSAYAAKSIEAVVAQNADNIAAIEINMANGDMHGNIAVLEKIVYTGVQTSVDLAGMETNATAITSKADKSYVDQQDALKADITTVNGHTGNTTVHVTQTDKTTWNAKADITGGTTQPASGYWFKEI